LVKELQDNDELAIDSHRTYVIGYSMGAFCTWGLISRFPTLFAAAVPIAGGGKPNGRIAIVACKTLACTFPLSMHLFVVNACHETEANDFIFTQLQNTQAQVWAFHSKADTVIPYDETVRNAAQLAIDRVRVTLFESLSHDDTLHTVIRNVNVFKWIFSKRLTSASGTMTRV
jgi:predicted peptidase